MAKTSAYQVQKTDIRINSICPGLIETAMTGDTFDHARSRGTEGKIGQLNPLGRYGVAEGTVSSRSVSLLPATKYAFPQR
jgi:NAD(P)-dependent dehydrogenase (short-subunit alcohol dehydrogenase family)